MPRIAVNGRMLWTLGGLVLLAVLGAWLLRVRSEAPGARLPAHRPLPEAPLPAPPPALVGLDPVEPVVVQPAPVVDRPTDSPTPGVDGVLRVVEADTGDPVADASLTTSWSGLHVEVLGEGRFRITGTLPPVGEFDGRGRDAVAERCLRAEAPGYRPTWGGLDRGRDVPAVIALQPEAVRVTRRDPEARVHVTRVEGHAHRVHVLGPAGLGLQGASVVLQDDDGRPPFIDSRAETDEGGWALLSALDPGLYRMRVAKEGYDPVHLKDVLVPEVGGPARTEVRLPVGGRHWIGGRVIDPAGEGIAGVRIEIRGHAPRRTRTDRDGAFRIEDLDDETNRLGFLQAHDRARGVTVYVEKKGWAGLRNYRAPFDREGLFVLARSARVIGAVLDPEGRPVRHPRIEFRPDAANPAFSAAEGTFLAQQAGDQVFRIRPRGGFRSSVLMAVPGKLVVSDPRLEFLPLFLPISPRAGETLDLGPLRLGRGARLHLQVKGRVARSFTKKDRVRVLVLHGEDGLARGSAWMQDDGSFVTGRPLAAGRYRLLPFFPGFVAPPVEIVLAEGDDRVLSLQAWPAASLTLVPALVGPPGTRWELEYEGPHTLAFAWSRATRRLRPTRIEGVGRDNPTGPDGPFPASTMSPWETVVFGRLPPGSYLLRKIASSGRVTTRKVDLEAGAQVVLDATDD